MLKPALRQGSTWGYGSASPVSTSAVTGLSALTEESIAFKGAFPSHCNKHKVSYSVVSDSVTPWTVACQAPLSMESSIQKILAWVAVPSSGGSS